MKYFCPLSIYWKGLWKFQHIPVAKFSAHFSHNCQAMVSMAHVCTCVQRYVFSHKWCQDRKGGGKVFMVCGCTGNQTSKMSKVTRWFILGQGRGVTVTHTQCWACWWLGKMCKVLPVCFETFSEYIPSCSCEKKRTGPPTCCTWNNGKLIQLNTYGLVVSEIMVGTKVRQGRAADCFLKQCSEGYCLGYATYLRLVRPPCPWLSTSTIQLHCKLH